MVRLTRTRLMKLVVASLGLVAVVALTSSEAFAAIGNTTMPFRYRLEEGGTTYGTERIFANTYYTPVGEDYCLQNHRDPDNNKYTHAHLPHGFSFPCWNVPEQQWDTVTVTKSDWAWNAAYSGYTYKSGSTFVHNCFSYAVGAPTVTFHDGWHAFTDVAPLNQATSMSQAGHAIKITVSSTGGCIPEYYVSKTIEKQASGGIYEKSWGGYPGKTTSGYELGKNK